MLFNSIDFLVFFPIVTVLYFLLPNRATPFMLLIASCFFYMFFIPKYIFILAITILIDYFAGIFIEESTGKRRKVYLVVSIISTCLVLAIFKYANFFNSNFLAIADFFHLKYPVHTLNIILPIGLSFHTFQSLSYVIEVYYGRQKTERNFINYSVYVMFYPQLVAGPIERPQNLLHQFRERHKFDIIRVLSGLKLMLWGFFKKLVIADSVAIVVNQVYSSPYDYHGLALIVATILFAFQIYCDFSGYSDIAIGAARVMGYDLMQNFNTPYFSRSISEFWRRWHISLSTWFKDYLYIPLGGSRVSYWRRNYNLFITFTISGLWHGANWTYVIWGMLNGFYLIIENTFSGFFKEPVNKTGVKFHIKDKFKLLYTFTLICISWIFFRAASLTDAWYILTHLFSFNNSYGELKLFFSDYDTIQGPLFILFMLLIQYKAGDTGFEGYIAGRSIFIRWSFYFLILFIVLLFGLFKSQHQFIYFQF